MTQHKMDNTKTSAFSSSTVSTEADDIKQRVPEHSLVFSENLGKLSYALEVQLFSGSKETPSGTKRPLNSACTGG